MERKQQSQLDLLLEFFKQHPNQDIAHPEIVDWATQEWRKRTGSVFRDPDRGIRSLHQKGYLIKVSKGVYRYDPQHATHKKQEDFTEKQKQEIFARDNFQCVICGQGRKQGFELHADHIKPKHLGGKATIENGQTLCSQHNFLKKNLQQTETGKKMFIRLYEVARQQGDKKLEKFCLDVLKVYDQHNINGHIKWSE